MLCCPTIHRADAGHQGRTAHDSRGERPNDNRRPGAAGVASPFRTEARRSLHARLGNSSPATGPGLSVTPDENWFRCTSRDGNDACRASPAPASSERRPRAPGSSPATPAPPHPPGPSRAFPRVSGCDTVEERTSRVLHLLNPGGHSWPARTAAPGGQRPAVTATVPAGAANAGFADPASADRRGARRYHPEMDRVRWAVSDCQDMWFTVRSGTQRARLEGTPAPGLGRNRGPR